MILLYKAADGFSLREFTKNIANYESISLSLFYYNCCDFNIKCIHFCDLGTDVITPSFNELISCQLIEK